MPMSSDVTLPRSKAVHFPDNCIRCGKEHPGETLAYSARESNFFSNWFLWWWPGKKVTVHVPVCSDCTAPLKRARTRREVINWIAVIAAVAICVPVIGHLNGGKISGSMKWVVMAAVILLLAPLFIYQALHPPVFDFTVYSEKIEYEFADENFATAFAQLNGGVVN